MASNYSRVQGQLRGAGLTGPEIEHLEIGRLVRCRVEGERERKGWYALHEIRTQSGDDLLIGSFGIWRGLDNGAVKIEIGKDDLTSDQMAVLRATWREDRKRAERARLAAAARAGKRAEAIWRKCSQTPPPGGSDYLSRKGIGAHGIRYSPEGALVLAIHDAAGQVHGLQFILSQLSHKVRIAKTGRDKEYWPAGIGKQGRFFQIGAISSLVLICEGYATGASLHEATGIPVVVAFDAGNLRPVVAAIRHAYRFANILICADDDFASPGNPGCTAASTAAVEVGGAWIAPRFAVEDQTQARARLSSIDWSDPVAARAVADAAIAEAGRKLTDFNDLHAAEGLLTVRAQVQAAVESRGWNVVSSASTPHTGGEGRPVTDWRFDMGVLLSEFTLVYGTDTAFDARRRLVVGLGPLRSAAGKSLVRQWLEHPERRTILQEQLGFDPAGTDSKIVCNLWAGWPTVPKAGSCDRLLELLAYLVSGEKTHQRELYQWVLRWIAYPIQHPGAKMATALLVHGPEGTGKNTFFGTVRRIYGRYACQFSQVELESNFNGWASGKLFAIGNEVVSRAELYHIQGRLKAMVTENEQIINEKMLPARPEANHCNFVFFSNRIDIAKLDDGDRRYCVIWTPPALDETFYQEVADELAHGGGEALHHYLAHLDLGDFSPHSKPPMTAAKADLVELGMDSTERFYRDWSGGTLHPDLARPCRSQDLYALYQSWARKEGIGKPAQKQTLLTAIGKKPGVRKGDERYSDGMTQGRSVLVIPKGVEPPPGIGRAAWLGGHVEQFRALLDQYTQE